METLLNFQKIPFRCGIRPASCEALRIQLCDGLSEIQINATSEADFPASYFIHTSHNKTVAAHVRSFAEKRNAGTPIRKNGKHQQIRKMTLIQRPSKKRKTIPPTNSRWKNLTFNKKIP
jgi:hypothetical protein